MESNKKNIVITSAVRTAVGTFNGSLKNMNGHDLGSAVVKELIKKLKCFCPAIRPALYQNLQD